MKLVLLPGMDGTGILFEMLLPEIQDIDLLVIPLPNDGPQDYKALSEYILELLPSEDFILVAESFSGGIAAFLSQQTLLHMKGIIFVASFLSAPRKTMAYLASCLPLSYLVQAPFSSIVYRLFFLGKEAESKEIKLFKRAISAVPNSTLKLRLKVIEKSRYDGFKSHVPTLYIGATRDMLIPSEKRKEFKEAYPEITFTELDGPHFILQAKPKEGAAAIIEAANFLTSKGS